ncbi:hypothetical protein Sste5346_005268 [Sporothrix stenoceras]|uniref:Uncharacterized protein n=1 Tax=Sporothrix stenoceras TaxID=5173 RepID=A0ABR3Z4A2_9PEZI
MATQVDSLGRGGTFKSFRPWRHREPTTAGHPAGGDNPLQMEHQRPRSMFSYQPTLHTQRISASHPAQADADADITDVISESSPLSTSQPPPSTDGRIPRTPGPIPHPQDSISPIPDTLPSTLPLTSPPPSTPPTSSFPSLKRRRALSDVDGPNTAALCCKKRRLRRFLITSRLSQPFSQPATHILNRESVAAGDKRFLKLAAIMNARRIAKTSSPTTSLTPTTPVASEVLRRAAMANRLRRRIYAEATAASTAGRPLTGIPLSLMANMANARFTIVPVSTAAAMAGRVPTTTTTTAAEVASSAVFAAVTPVPVGAVGVGISGGRWKPASVLKSPPLAAHRPIVRAVSRSPKLRPRDARPHTRPSRIESVETSPTCYASTEDDDSECSFPTSEHDHNGDDDDTSDTEDVYADFSVLFSSDTAGDELDDLDKLDGLDGLDGLDDYMDELDGIAHLPRQAT